MKKLSILAGVVAWLLITAMLQSQAYPYETYRGRIVDSQTGEPVEGVVILATWYEEGDPRAMCSGKAFIDVRETLSDAKGDFALSEQGIRRIPYRLKEVRFTIFKAGYECRDIDHHCFEERKYSVSFRRTIRLEGGRAIIPVRKLSREERPERALLPPREAPLENILLFLKEIDKESVECGFEPRGLWNGKQY